MLDPDDVLVAGGGHKDVGDADDLVATYGGTVDASLSDKVLLPGFVEAHSHKDTGGIWQHTYVGHQGRIGPEGKWWPGCSTPESVVERLREADREIGDPDEPLLAWGLDPIYWTGERFDRRQLDAVSTTRQIFVIHSNMHLATVNSALMEAQGITPDTMAEGVPKDASGWPTGELQEPAAMFLAGKPFRSFFGRLRSDESILECDRAARNVGVTTVTDLGTSNLLDEPLVHQHLHGPSDVLGPGAVELDAAGRLVGGEVAEPIRLEVAFHQPAGGDHLADVQLSLIHI